MLALDMVKNQCLSGKNRGPNPLFLLHDLVSRARFSIRRQGQGEIRLFHEKRRGG